jgi:hypothetical protein
MKSSTSISFSIRAFLAFLFYGRLALLHSFKHTKGELKWFLRKTGFFRNLGNCILSKRTFLTAFLIT